MSSIQIALDTVSLHRTCRRSPLNRRQNATNPLTAPIAAGRLKIGVDPQRAIIDEWCRTVGEDTVQQLVIAWFDAGGLFTVSALGRLPKGMVQQLRKLGFIDTIDKLLLRVAVVLDDRIVVSDDSDFWDPGTRARRQCIGNANAPVAYLLSAKLNVTMRSLRQLMDLLK